MPGRQARISPGSEMLPESSNGFDRKCFEEVCGPLLDQGAQLKVVQMASGEYSQPPAEWDPDLPTLRAALDPVELSKYLFPIASSRCRSRRLMVYLLLFSQFSNRVPMNFRHRDRQREDAIG